jgi:hypothetical protein
MPTLYKTINIDLSDAKKVPLIFKLHAKCLNCGLEMTKDFKERYLAYPIEKKPFKLELYCIKCHTLHNIPAMIQNIRLILAYDLEKIKIAEY